MSALVLLSILLAAEPSSVSAAAAERAMKSVVSVHVVRFLGEGDGLSDRLLEVFSRDEGHRSRKPTLRGRAHGSAVVISSDGLLLTCRHVVDRAESIAVVTSEGRELRASLLAFDTATDLAVLRVELEGSLLTAIELGDSSRLGVGEPVLAVGDSFGLGLAVSAGVISAKGRTDLGTAELEELLQTDAGISPGDSGGALVDLRGRLVGINAVIVSDAERNRSIGFAVPIEVALPVMQALVQDGHVVRGYLGATVQAMEARFKKVFGSAEIDGAVITDVSPNGPADEAGLVPEEVIFAIDGRRFSTPGALENAIASKRPGTRIELDVRWKRQERRVSVVLGERPAAPDPGGEIVISDRPLGAMFVRIDSMARELFDLAPEVTKGTVVADLEVGGVAQLAGLRLGDVVVEVDRQVIDQPDAVELAWRSGNRELLLRVVRAGLYHFVVLLPPAAAELP